MGSEQVVLYCIKGNTFTIFFFLFPIKKTSSFQGNRWNYLWFYDCELFQEESRCKGNKQLGKKCDYILSSETTLFYGKYNKNHATVFEIFLTVKWVHKNVIEWSFVFPVIKRSWQLDETFEIIFLFLKAD